MCGITGILAFNLVGKFNKVHITTATMCMARRGPDFQDVYTDEWVGLGHRRLSIIDTSAGANQPMWDESKRYCIVFNGEIFNYRELRQELESKGVAFNTHSDTEVLLQLYIREKEKALPRFNGFFAFCVYDRHEQSFFVARDRFGIKPLLYLFDDDKFIFASDMKTIIQYGIDKEIDFTSLFTYLQLNYIPAPRTICTNIKKLLPGHHAKISSKRISIGKWYEIPYNRDHAQYAVNDYDGAKKKFSFLLESSVQRRLVADVPLGAFLSGGIDSSVITGLASRHKPDLHTFSIGFKDEKFFDETEYARLVSKHFNTRHTVFSLSKNDLFSHVHAILDCMNEPFADSSAINVFILSKETRRQATVALSGDGADELLGGYNKHAAFYRMVHKGWKEKLIQSAEPLFRLLPQSRNNPLANKVRQLARFAAGAKLHPAQRYWQWATFADEHASRKLLSQSALKNLNEVTYQIEKSELLKHIPENHSINDILLTDMQLVLPNDMLTKVDMMSMAQSLEVRVPFLDYEVVDFIFSLPPEFKINKQIRKRILQDSFRDMLPPQLYNRPKKGFEVPLLRWLRNEMRSIITDDLLARDTIEDQKIFNYTEIEKLTKQLFSNNPGDSQARIWGLLVFQWWWKRHMK